MSTARYQNRRKVALKRLKDAMLKDGYAFKKLIKNTADFRHSLTGEKKRIPLEY